MRSCLVCRASLAPKAPNCAALSNDCKISAAFSRNVPAFAIPPWITLGRFPIGFVFGLIGGNPEVGKG